MEEVPGEDFFSIPENFFSKFLYKIFVIVLHNIIGLQNFSFSLPNHNPELRRVICAGVSLQLHCTKPIRVG